MIFFYLFIPIFLLVTLYKGLAYEENWQYRGFKAFLICSAKDSLLVIVFALCYCALPKIMHKRIINSYLNELNKLKTLNVEIGPRNSAKDMNHYYMSLSGDANELCCPVLRYSGPGYDQIFESKVSEEPEQSLEVLLKYIHQKMQANDHSIDSKVLIKDFFSALKFDLMHWDIFNSFTFSFNLSIPSEIRDEDIFVNLYPCNMSTKSPKFVIAKVFLLNALFNQAPFYWNVSRHSGVTGQMNRFQEFKSRHGLHPKDSIYTWMGNLNKTTKNQWIFDDWENTKELNMSETHSEDRGGNFEDISFTLNDWADQLLYWYKNKN